MPKQRVRISAVNLAIAAQKKRILTAALSTQTPKVIRQEEAMLGVALSTKEEETTYLIAENIADENSLSNTEDNISLS